MRTPAITLLLTTVLAAAPSPAARADEVGGTISIDTNWTAAGNPWVVTGTVTVAGPATLTIGAGVQVEVAPLLSILAQGGGGIDVQGEPGNPVLFRARNPGQNWIRIGAQGAGSHITMRHAEVANGQGVTLDGASGRFESCYFHDYYGVSGGPAYNQPILVSNYAASLLVQACHFQNYYETLFRHGVITVEDSLFEGVSGDAIDFDTAAPGSIIRRCTFRHGLATNVDGIDLGSDTQGTEVSHCLIYDFPFDKGVSIGEKSSNIVVRSCVIYDVDIGVAVKDSSEAFIENNTIVSTGSALNLYEKTAGQGPGYATAWNIILWDNTAPVTLEDGSVLGLTYSDVQGGYPGGANLDTPPGFRNAASNDYRLVAGSPCIGTGQGGATMGALFPVGSFLVDTDADSLPDTWEMTYGLDFNNPADAANDDDNDGMSNRDEHVAGTAPDDPDSLLQLAVTAPDPAGAGIHFEAVAGKSYTVQYLGEIETQDWQFLVDVPAPTSTTTQVIHDPDGATAHHRFYRILIPVPALAPTNVPLVSAGATWRYFDQGRTPAANWDDPDYDDNGWDSGPAELGYGEGDEATEVSYGGNSSAKYITTYFRHTFTVPDAEAIETLEILLKRDDAAVVYLNGQELFRSNLPDGLIDYATEAPLADDDGKTWWAATHSAATLRSGPNVLAVEIHQDSPTSSDVSFDLSLEGVPAAGSTAFSPPP